MVGDGVIIQPVDVHFEIIWRTAEGEDTVLAEFDHHFDPIGGGVFDAVPFEATGEIPANGSQAGDQVVWRMVTTGTEAPTAYIPNGEGANVNGRVPFIDLPR